jgi:hypothetical protein
MTTRWLSVLLLAVACDAGPVDRRAPATVPLSGPTPPSRFVSIEEPTADTIRRVIGGWYSFPDLHTVVGDRGDGGITWFLS